MTPEEQLHDSLTRLAQPFCKTAYALEFHLALSSFDLSDVDEVRRVFFDPPRDLSTQLDAIAALAVETTGAADLARRYMSLRVRPIQYEQFIRSRGFSDDPDLAPHIAAISDARSRLFDGHSSQLETIEEPQRVHASEGLRRASLRFDPSGGYTFQSYASHWIRRAIEIEAAV